MWEARLHLLGDNFIYSGFVPVRCGEFYDGRPALWNGDAGMMPYLGPIRA
jgi:hypothetical protein